MINKDIFYVEVKIDAIYWNIRMVFLIDFVIELRSQCGSKRALRLYARRLSFVSRVGPGLCTKLVDPGRSCSRKTLINLSIRRYLELWRPKQNIEKEA